MRWQESQDFAVTKWLPGLPLARAPLWQMTQVAGATPIWLNVAGFHVVVRWQESHEAVVGRWLPSLPGALEPL